ncbi:hypothetical protein E2542_SST12965 [Spatholobus suberectus]|nr:hypothetical protein E2542_SST12965 [Spatholobus suberectus]
MSGDRGRAAVLSPAPAKAMHGRAGDCSVQVRTCVHSDWDLHSSGFVGGSIWRIGLWVWVSVVSVYGGLCVLMRIAGFGDGSVVWALPEKVRDLDVGDGLFSLFSHYWLVLLMVGFMARGLRMGSLGVGKWMLMVLFRLILLPLFCYFLFLLHVFTV